MTTFPWPCAVDLSAYSSLTGPHLHLDAGGIFLRGSTGKMSGGAAEYALPACASASSASSFDLRARLLVLPSHGDLFHGHPAPRQCNVTINKIVRHAIGEDHNSADTTTTLLSPGVMIRKPLISPLHQVAIVIERLTSGCRLSDLRLEPRQATQPSQFNLTRPRPLTAVADISATSGPSASLEPSPWDHALSSSGLRPCWRSTSASIAHVCGGSDSSSRSSSMRYGMHCAYATLVLGDHYLPYAYALARSLHAAGSQAPLVLLVSADVTNSALELLQKLCGGAAGIGGTPSLGRIRVKRISSQPHPPLSSRHGGLADPDDESASIELQARQMAKLEAWRLTEYRKV